MFQIHVSSPPEVAQPPSSVHLDTFSFSSRTSSLAELVNTDLLATIFSGKGLL